MSAETASSTVDVHLGGKGVVPLSLTRRGEGRNFLLLHGGGGPMTVTGFADLLAGERPAHVVTPVHPGFAGTPRPDSIATVSDLADLYTQLLFELDLDEVTVVGNSIGGWIAAEMALNDTTRVSGFVLVDAVAIEVPGHPVVDFFSLTPKQVAGRSYHDPDRFGIDPAKLPEEARAAMATNRLTLAVYGGTSMSDAGLARRLAAVTTPTLVLWGDSDRIADPDYGRALAAAIPGARFELLRATGHLPQVETPELMLESIWSFASRSRK